MMKTLRAGWDARRIRMVLFASLLVVMSLSFKIWDCPESIHPKLCHALGAIGDTLLVISVTVLFTETGPFKSYVEERLTSLTELINKPVLERMKDTTFLRGNLSSEYLREIRKASTFALLPQHLTKYPEFLSVIDKVVLPLAEESVWRKDYSVTVIHTIDQINGHTVIMEKTLMLATYINTSDKSIEYPVPFNLEYKKIDGVSSDRLCCDMHVFVDGIERKLEITKSDKGDSIHFETALKITVEARPVSVREQHSAIFPSEDLTRLTFSLPTTGLELTYIHPPEIKPELYAFNVGGTLVNVAEEATVHQWKHDGVFLPEHGVVLYHPIPRHHQTYQTKVLTPAVKATGNATVTETTEPEDIVAVAKRPVVVVDRMTG